MKKLSNNNGVIKSSTLAGQRELLREYRNKINEMIEEYDARFQTHEDRINSIAEDKGENMKQTPIPEKINTDRISILLSDIRAIKNIKTKIALLSLVNFIAPGHNSIIDVVTEQQKEIEKGDLLRMQMIANLSVRINQIEHNVGLHDKGCTCQRVGINPEPYTAMRSTGAKLHERMGLPNDGYIHVNKYCVCDHIGIPDSNICSACSKPIKPQEDARSTGEADCCYKNPDCPICPKNVKSQEDVREIAARCIWRDEEWHGTQEGAKIIVDSILAIVKGE